MASAKKITKKKKLVTRENLTKEDKLKILRRLHGIFQGGPSMTDELIKERRSDKW